MAFNKSYICIMSRYLVIYIFQKPHKKTIFAFKSKVDYKCT